MRSSPSNLFAAIALALAACGHAAAPAPPPPPTTSSTPDAAVTTDIAPLPADTPTTIDAVADALVLAFDDADRAPARKLLVDDILPWDLRSLPTFPQPKALVKAGYDGIAQRLATVPRAQRLAMLDEIACDRRGDQLVGRAISLAVARWIADHRRPTARDDVAGFVEDAAPYLSMSADARNAEADRLEASLTAWSRDAAARHPSCAEQHRIPLVHARAALASARTGRFDPAMGALRDFLVGVGEHPRTLDPH
jgi:hypothetical protein